MDRGRPPARALVAGPGKLTAIEKGPRDARPKFREETPKKGVRHRRLGATMHRGANMAPSLSINKQIIENAFVP